MPELRIGNFKLGQRADGALREDALWSMRRTINWEIIYSDGRLRVRGGSDRWNDLPLAAPADQLFYWIDRDQNENLLALVGGATERWYVARPSLAHILLRDEAATARCMVVDLGDRIVFATDTGLYWSDNASIPGLTPSYRLGIKKPADPPQALWSNVDGNYAALQKPSLALSRYILNTTNHRKVSASFTATGNQEMDQIDLEFGWNLGVYLGGSLRVTICEDNAGEPGPVVPNGTSDWLVIAARSPNAYFRRSFLFEDLVSLTAATTYHLVVEGDDDYYTYYGAAYYVFFAFNNAAGGMNYDQGTGLWAASVKKLGFWIGGLVDDYYYDYLVTYFNEEYGIESRPSDAERVLAASDRRFTVFAPATTDPQVSHVRVYRRTVGDDPSIAESAITDLYALVGQIAYNAGFVDVSTAVRGDDLQTQDHYCYDDTEGGADSTRPDALVPGPGCYWNGRIWMAEPHGAVLYFTKKLTKRGATGIVGDSEPDFFPLDNRLELPVSSDVIAVEPIGDQQLGVYFRDESVWVIWGAADPLNPPADIMQRKILSDNGLIGPGAISEMLGRHVYLSRDGLRSFGGSQTPLYAVSSETNQTILDDIQDQYLRDSVIAVFGPEIWLLVDRDNDGDLDTVMILDLQRELPSREIVDRAWRMYQYSEALKDLVVKPTATTFRVMLAASADTNYVLELGTATRTDLGSAIACELETHDMRAENMAFAYELNIHPKYPGTPPTWAVTVTDHGDRTATYTLSPTSSMDIRGHRTGLRMNSPVSVRVKLQQSSVEADELLSLAVGYKGE